MAGITLAQAEARLQNYMDAEESVLGGQEYQLGGRSLKRADLKEIREGLTYWNEQVRVLSSAANGRGRSVTVARR